MQARLKVITEYLSNPANSVQDKSFGILGIVSIFAFIANVILGTILLGVDKKIPILMFSGLAFIIIILCVGIGMRFNKSKIARDVVAFVLTVLIIPLMFLRGGGINGAAPIWFAFSAVYIVMIVSGRAKIFFFCIGGINTLICWIEGIRHPEISALFAGNKLYLDYNLNLLIVSVVMTILVGSQTWFYSVESKRSEKQKKDIEELNRAQNRFFSNMSHEIRTPINTILGLNEIILRQDDASDEIIKDAANIQGAGRMLLTLINDILDMSKIESKKMDIVPVDYRVGDLISEIVNMMWLKASNKGLEFNVDIDPSIPSELYGDEVRIKQILINLLNNAVKYTQKGSVTLHMECEKIESEYVKLNISVEDTGMGIKKESIPYLFDVFRREDEEKNRYIEGTGLGLSIVKQLVELMGGKISVSSVYSAGSTFSVSLRQQISNPTVIGNINIEDFDKSTHKHSYERTFLAPEARILIVDDNEMNLEVESKLLADTSMIIDKALSGKDALLYTSQEHYDVILMDHLMPEMDGIECFRAIRNQVGGASKDSPIIVLTANAGGENRQIYNMTGFDDYLVKPVSGNQLCETLLKYLPDDKVKLNEASEIAGRITRTSVGYTKKQSVLITATSMCDLPADLVRDIPLFIIPFYIHVDGAVFLDVYDMDSDEIVRYMSEHEDIVKSSPPTVEDFERTFKEKSKKFHEIVHISLTSAISKEFENATKAAESFDNVTVINAGSLSSAHGLILMLAAKMAMLGETVDRIVHEVDVAKSLVRSGFVVGSTEYLARSGKISQKIHRTISNLSIHPSLVVKDGALGIDRVFIGDIKHAYKKYIDYVLAKPKNIDTDILFITYIAVSEVNLKWIEKEVRKRVPFKHIIIQKASASVSLNCGPETFGLLFFNKGEKTYNVSSILPTGKDNVIEGQVNENVQDSLSDNTVNTSEVRHSETKNTDSLKWYEKIEGINPEEAVKNSGSENGLIDVFKLFYNSIDSKANVLNDYFDSEDWENYIIKIHALKSSARLVGAIELGDEAEKLEFAGKAKDIDYILSNHERIIKSYLNYKVILHPLFENQSTEDSSSQKIMANDTIMEIAYATIKQAAIEMDVDSMEKAFEEMEDYQIPDNESERFEKIKACSDEFDYDGIIRLLEE